MIPDTICKMKTNGTIKFTVIIEIKELKKLIILPKNVGCLIPSFVGNLLTLASHKSSDIPFIGSLYIKLLTV